ncbi:hypothetical protein BJX96DRAFT_160889 [Aspergillus floccosus]
MLPHALELDPIDREEIFDFIVVKTKERHGKRYGWFFETDVGKTVGKSLEEYLTPAVRDICESGSFTLESLRSIGGDCDPPRAGVYMNILWQRFPGDTSATDERRDREMFLKFHSEDPAIRGWAEWARNSYNDLRNPPDPRLREYWFENKKEQLQLAREASELIYRENMKVYQEHGSERIVKWAPDRDRGYVNCGKYVFSVLQLLVIPTGSRVHVRFHLCQVPVSFRYAQQARPDDPSSRLAV